jgi:hypothetical protein
MRRNKYVIATIVMVSALFIFVGWKYATRPSRHQQILSRPCEPTDESGKSRKGETCRSGVSYYFSGRWTPCICSSK